jgi:low temperature requirement protein LtrA
LNSPVPEEPQRGKRVSWVELYFDLIFVFAVGQTARVVTVGLAFLKPLISTTGVVLVTAAWAVAIAAHASWRTPGRLKGIAANPLAYFGSPPAKRNGGTVEL